MTPLVSNESEAISRILEFLTYSGVDAVKKYDEESDLYQIFIPEDQYDRASALLAIFMEQEPSEEEEEETDEPVRSFVGNGERYQENSSSAFSFLTVGLLVAALLLLCTFHVIPIPLTWDSQPVMYAALWIITAAFLIIGIFSLWKARDYRQKMHEDAEFEAGVLKWFLDTYDGDQTLKDNTQRGSADSPYDLSTHDEKGNVIPQTTANCYVVSAAGTYQLPLVYGNAIKNGSNNSAAYQGFKDYLDRAISSPRITGADNAVLVWSDGFFMFKDIHLDATKENLVFTIDSNYMQQANAVLAVRDASNRIMWSWHIWVTERPVYTERHILQDLFVDSNTYELMQCNLGWVDGKMVYYNQRDLTFRFTQAGSGRTDELIVRQEGETFDYKDVGSTYYQWGRKDPLVALKNWDSYRYEDYRLHETGAPDYVYRYETGPTTIGNAIQHPNVFYTRGTTGGADWNGDHTPTLWNADADGGTLESTTSVKTIYDPSPRGFKVPMPRAFAIWVNGHDGDESTKGELNGYVFGDDVHNKYRVYPQANGQGTEIPLTATGQRADIGGKLEVYEQDRPLKAEVGGLWSLYGVYYWT